MIRLWRLVRYFAHYYSPHTAPVFEWHRGVINQYVFTSHLISQKHFMEDWRDTLWCWYDYIATGIWTVGARTRGGARIQRRKVDDILEDAIRRKYLLVAYITPDVGDIELPDGSVTKNSAMDARLSIDDRGRNFLKPLPFFEASLKEYGHVVSFFLGAGGTLLVMFWNSIIDYLAKF